MQQVVVVGCPRTLHLDLFQVTVVYQVDLDPVTDVGTGTAGPVRLV